MSPISTNRDEEASLVKRWLADEELRELARNSDVVFSFDRSDGERIAVFCFRDGVVSVYAADDIDVEFSVILSEVDWSLVMSPNPPPRKQSVLAFLNPEAGGSIGGSELAFAQHLQLVRRLVEIARGEQVDSAAAANSDLSALRGSYTRMVVPGVGEVDVYSERSGTGRPVVLLATAGSDTRQFHGVMTDPELSSRHELIAVDLPWHGKSNPAVGQRNSSYSLDSDKYVATVASFLQSLNLDQLPVVVGSSMAGALVVELAARHPSAVLGVVGAQVGPRVANRRTPWLRNPRVNQTLHAAEWTYGLMSPLSPKRYRDLVWWGYSQGGYGVYDGDIGYYVGSWDVDNITHLLDSQTPPVVLLSGIYDYSVPPERTAELARLVPGSIHREMPELGHFPQAENPPVYSRYLSWALEKIYERSLSLETGLQRPHQQLKENK
jgi:pimeloyl-ACP methyl ester carboxylesterase